MYRLESEYIYSEPYVHIFVTPNFTVEKYGVLTDTYRTKNETTGKYESHIPSDHFPVKAVLKFQKKH